MFKKRKDKTVLALSLPLSLLVTVGSCVGLLTEHFYGRETPNWQAQSLGQDMVDLFLIVPCLLATAVSAYRGSRAAKLVWGGVVLYLAYTFAIYCFDVHFNKLFLLYCACFGLSVYSVIYFLFTEINNAPAIANTGIVRFIGIYFIGIAILFCGLWLTEVVPAVIRDTVPKSISDAGLPTNGVQVIDLSFFLPATFIAGILLLKKRPLGFVLAPAILTFFVLMDITIGVLMFVMKGKGIESDLTIATGMFVLAFISVIFLVLFFKSCKMKSADGAG